MLGGFADKGYLIRKDSQNVGIPYSTSEFFTVSEPSPTMLQQNGLLLDSNAERKIALHILSHSHIQNRLNRSATTSLTDCINGRASVVNLFSFYLVTRVLLVSRPLETGFLPACISFAKALGFDVTHSVEGVCREWLIFEAFDAKRPKQRIPFRAFPLLRFFPLQD